MLSLHEVEKLILKVGLSDRSAFLSLYDATSAKLFAVCLSVLKNRADAEDTLQDVYEKIWRKANLFKQTGHSPMTWLISMARNASIDRLRARKTTVDIDNEVGLHDTSPAPEQVTYMAMERTRLDSCLGELVDNRSDAVRKAYIDGYSYKELAVRHDVPLNTMRTWLRRSLLALKDCLDK